MQEARAGRCRRRDVGAGWPAPQRQAASSPLERSYAGRTEQSQGDRRREAPLDTCIPEGQEAVRETREAVLTRDTHGDFYGCLRARGVPVPIDGFGEGRGEWRERISLAGPLVAYRDYGCDEDLCIEFYTYIRVLDLRSGTEKSHEAFPFPEDSNNEVGAVRVRRDGTVAWTTCRTSARRCRSGKLVRLLVASPGSAPGLLDIGRDLDRFSPRWKGTRLRWTRAGRARSVSVP